MAQQEEFKKTLPKQLKALRRKYGEVDLWSQDEERIGLFPIIHKVASGPNF